MKISSHKCYYCTPYSWDYWERLNEYRRGRFSNYRRPGGHAEPCRFRKPTSISKISRSLIKRGILDGVDLVNFNEDEYKEKATEINQPLSYYYRLYGL